MFGYVEVSMKQKSVSTPPISTDKKWLDTELKYPNEGMNEWILGCILLKWLIYS